MILSHPDVRMCAVLHWNNLHSKGDYYSAEVHYEWTRTMVNNFIRQKLHLRITKITWMKLFQVFLHSNQLGVSCDVITTSTPVLDCALSTAQVAAVSSSPPTWKKDFHYSLEKSVGIQDNHKIWEFDRSEGSSDEKMPKLFQLCFRFNFWKKNWILDM